MLSRLRCIHRARRSFTSLSTLPSTIKDVLSKPPPDENGYTSPSTVYGWVKSVRRQKKVSFAVINDGTTLKGLQAVFLHPNGEQNTSLRNLVTGASVRLTGRLIESPGKGQERELQVEDVQILGECDPETYPIQKKDHSVEFFREHVHLRPRTTSVGVMLRVRDKLSRGFNEWYQTAGFIYSHPPILTGNDCEGGGETFRVSLDTDITTAEHPQRPIRPTTPLMATPEPTSAYLTVSTQLHLEALAASLARVYTIAPAFRAERSQTNRHLNEFWMLEAELSFLPTGLDGVCDVVEVSLKSVLGNLAKDEDVKYLRESSSSAPSDEHINAWLDPAIRWRRVTYSDALELLEAHHLSGAEPKFKHPPPKWGEGFRSEHERWIAGALGRSETGAQVEGPVFVTHYPRQMKPFYMWVDDADPIGLESAAADSRETVACFDLLVPKLGELTGGSVRESRLEMLKESLALHGLSEAQYSWYLDLRRYGTTPHGGFGIGFERLVSWFCGVESVRECIPFPRWAGKVVL
ncbi:hypothetical protein M422DRAFT_258298 [Sphaerobolus stellatus SS14]|uniref:asparagine--tRNA ligase n=1 Tax=Sphaerobolus stellatus (strain SS14) TaxID=990650 RepID=A0A0C9VMK9_SPHS4|nr:hypothetical protein M422DRAFT_258298 [Sphaerobolus stellatus SS14]